MTNLMTLCRNVATDVKLSLSTLFAILFLTSLLSQAVVAQESFDSFPPLESPSAVVVEAEVGQSILEYLDALDSPQDANVPDDLNVADDPNVLEDLNVLTRGPLHEAFASAHQADPEPSALVLKMPPESIDEVPPEYKPDGNSIQWISGYWAWDDAQSDFIWISGIWRDVPPSRRWIPGYWNAEGDGHRWISGVWAEETKLDLGYLPEPPASLEQGPSTTAPGEDYFYVPGNWTRQDANYRWSAGHWQPLVENWIWIPARYVWTPNGCVYQSGYWDYEMDNRGTCFAPVQFTQPVYLANNYSYRPSYALNLNVDFLTHLFVRPRCGHYFYGDWYASNFNNVQYRPWVSYSSHFRSYDPLLAYYSHRRSSFDTRSSVVQYVSRQHNFYVNNRDYRPRPTYRSQNSYAHKFKHIHATGSKGSKGQRRPYDDFLRKSTYVRSYKDLRTHDDRRHGQSFDGRNRGNQQIKSKHHHKIADKDLRDMRRKVDQLAKAQRDRKRKEHSGRQPSGNQVVVLKPSGKVPSQKPAIVNRSTNRRTGDSISDLMRQRSSQPDRRSQSTRNAQRDTARLAEQQKQARQQRDRDAARRLAQQDQARRSQNDQARKAQQDRARQAAQQSQRDAARKAQQKAQQDQARRSQQDQARRAQQDQARRAQQESARRAQEQVRRFQQQQKQSDASANISGKMRMQNIPSRDIRAQAARQDQRDRARIAAQKSQQDAARRAQQKAQQDQAQRARQDQARRAQQDQARRAQQDQARRNQQRAQQQRSQQQAAQRAKQQQAQRDAAKRAQQKSQRDAAKRAQANRQKAAQKKQKSPAEQSRASRLRNRSSSKK